MPSALRIRANPLTAFTLMTFLLWPGSYRLASLDGIRVPVAMWTERATSVACVLHHCAFMTQRLARALVTTLCVALAGCTLSRPHYHELDVKVGDPAFVRAVEAHTMSGLVDGNRATVLLNGDEIYPAMLAAIRQAKKT